MENRDRDKLNRNSTEGSENLNEPNRGDESVDSEGMFGEKGRSSGSTGSDSGVESERESKIDRDRSETRH